MTSQEKRLAIQRGSTTTDLDTLDPDQIVRPVEVISDAEKVRREAERQQLVGLALARQGEGTGPRARRGKPDNLRSTDYTAPEPAVPVESDCVDEEAALDAAPIQGQASDEEGVAAFHATIDALATLRKDREVAKVESKRAFEEAERNLLAQRDRIQRGLERQRQLSAQRDVRAHVQALRNQAQAEIPSDPADRRGDYHKRFLAQAAPLLAAVRDTQSELAAFAKSTVPALRQIAALSENDVPVSWQSHHRTRLIGLAQTAGKLVGEHQGFVAQAERVVHTADRLLAQEVIPDDVDQRTRCNGLLRDLGYASSGVMEHLTSRADSIVAAFATARAEGEEFRQKSEPIVIVLNPPDRGRELLRRGEHRRYKEPKREPGVLDSLGIDTSTPPRI